MCFPVNISMPENGIFWFFMFHFFRTSLWSSNHESFFFRCCFENGHFWIFDRTIFFVRWTFLNSVADSVTKTFWNHFWDFSSKPATDVQYPILIHCLAFSIHRKDCFGTEYFTSCVEALLLNEEIDVFNRYRMQLGKK